MEKQKVRHFKNKHVQLAKRIARKLGGVSYEVFFEQNVKGDRLHWSRGVRDYDHSMIVIPNNIEPARKYRVIVYMFFRGKYKKRVVNSVLKRWHEVVESTDRGFVIRTSANLSTISSF